RGGGSAERATRGGGARRAGRLLRPSGAASIARNLPRVALAPPVATNLRPSGAADPCASYVQTRRFFTDERFSTPRRGAGMLPRVERSRRRSATRGKSRELMSRPGGAEEARDGQRAAEAQDAPGVSSAPPGRPPYPRPLPRVALALLAPPVATNLRPSGAASLSTPPSTGCARCARFTRGNQP